MKDKLSKKFIKIPGSNYGINEQGQVKNLITRVILKPFLVSGYPACNITVDGKRKIAYIHHLMAKIFLDYTAKRGTTTINHIDQNKENNRIDNLEVISHRRNTALTYIHRDRELPTGVSNNHRGKKKYKASINYLGKPVYLGSFETPEEASQAYMDASDYIIANNSKPPGAKTRKG
jgi:hypothetical protein